MIDVKKMFMSVDLSLISEKGTFRYVWAKQGEPIKVCCHEILAFEVIPSPYPTMLCYLTPLSF